jgi:alpha-L-rhamnosidase
MSDHPQDFTALAGSAVEIEAFGVPGTLGRLAAPLANPPAVRMAHEAFWIPNPPREQDLHVGFVADFRLATDGEVRLRVIAPAAYRLMVDDRELAWGPLRFAPAMPEYQKCRVTLPAGPHRVSLHVIHEGLTTRLAACMPGFVWVDLAGDLEVPPEWSGRHLTEYLATGLRVSPLQGWMEWTQSPRAGAWRTEDPSRDPGWSKVVPVPEMEKILGPACASPVQLPVWPSIVPEVKEHGIYRDTYYCYRFDDPAVAFMVADPAPDPATGPDGTWQRFDLGRIRIGAPEFEVRAEDAGEVTIAYAERLGPDGRPVPIVAGSTGPTRFLQKYAFGPGCTPIRPLQTLGARYLEIRLACTGEAELNELRFRERDLLGDPPGRLTLHDGLLDRIWSVGIDTMRASTEDSAVDSVRERGEWTGDVALAGIELLGVGWGDMAPARRALYHSAAAAREDGMVSGCGPGELIYLGTYAAQWVNACVRCAELEGGTGLLVDLEGPARRNIQALLACVEPDGRHHLPWSFVDWGYQQPAKDRLEPAVLAHVVAAVDAWDRWQKLLGHDGAGAACKHQAEELRTIVRSAVAEDPGFYHAAVLGERIGAVSRDAAVAVTLQQLRSSFPCNPAGKRLRDPTQASPAVATPYFTNYSIDLLIRAGRVDEAIEIWRKAWGWMLDGGATTWWEVFDERWSRCHYWAGAPTWQMSRRILGADPALHDGRPVIRIAVHPGSLRRADGSALFPGAGLADISWRRENDAIVYQVTCPAPWTLWRNGAPVPCAAGTTELRLRADGCAFGP